MIDINELFNTKDKSEAVVANFKSLKTHAGWQMLVQIVEANIKVLEEQILNGIEDETKEQIDRKRDKLKAYKEVISTPDYWITHFVTPKPFVEESDPYDTPDTMLKSRKDS